jgi:hypothetical protein
MGMGYAFGTFLKQVDKGLEASCLQAEANKTGA